MVDFLLSGARLWVASYAWRHPRISLEHSFLPIAGPVSPAVGRDIGYFVTGPGSNVLPKQGPYLGCIHKTQPDTLIAGVI
jgi:hypothetical protein